MEFFAKIKYKSPKLMVYNSRTCKHEYCSRSVMYPWLLTATDVNNKHLNA